MPRTTCEASAFKLFWGDKAIGDQGSSIALIPNPQFESLIFFFQRTARGVQIGKVSHRWD